MSNSVLVVFSSNDEVFVTTPEKEEEVVQSLFKYSDRDIKDFDREEIHAFVEISSKLKVR